MHCYFCNQIIDNGSRFCGYCGKEQPRLKKCKKCGCDIDEHALFCKRCGADQSLGEITDNSSNIKQGKQNGKKKISIILSTLTALFVIVFVVGILLKSNNIFTKSNSNEVNMTPISYQDDNTSQSIKESSIGSDIIQESDNKLVAAEEIPDVSSEEEMNSQNFQNVTYSTYQNNTFGYIIDYPHFMSVEKFSEEQITFKYGNNVIITVLYEIKEDGLTIQDYFKQAKRTADQYTRVKNNFYVRSGYNSEGNIYYEKAILKNEALYTVRFIYPDYLKNEFDSIITHMLKSFIIT